jgi:hypothetical protein
MRQPSREETYAEWVQSIIISFLKEGREPTVEELEDGIEQSDWLLELGDYTNACSWSNSYSFYITRELIMEALDLYVIERNERHKRKEKEDESNQIS